MMQPVDRVLQGAVVLSLVLHLVVLAVLRMPGQAAHDAGSSPLTVQLLQRTVPMTAPMSQPSRARPAPASHPAVRPLALPAEAQSTLPLSPVVAAVSPAVSESAAAAPAAQATAASTAAEMVPPRFDAAYLDNPQPSYPVLSRRLGEQGRVLLRVLVSGEGRAREVLVKGGSGFARLDQAAREAVLRWRFLPARQGSQAVEAWVLVPITFSLS